MLDVLDAKNCVVKTLRAQDGKRVQHPRNRVISDGMNPHINALLCSSVCSPEHRFGIGYSDAPLIRRIQKRSAQLGGVRAKRTIGKNLDRLQAEPFITQSAHNSQFACEVELVSGNRMD